MPFKDRNKQLEHDRKYYRCSINPSCSIFKVGSQGFKPFLFNCEVCGKEVRKSLAKVEYVYDLTGTLPRFCSNKCKYISRRNDWKEQSSYAKKIKNLLKTV